MKIALSWVLYCLGDLVSKPMDRLPFLYPIYSRLMCWSIQLQGATFERGPWHSPECECARCKFWGSFGEDEDDAEV